MSSNIMESKKKKKKSKKRKKGFWTCVTFAYASPWPFLFLWAKREMKGFVLRDQLPRHPTGEAEGAHLSQRDWMPAFSLQVIPLWFLRLHGSAGKTNVSGITASRVPQTHMLSKCACFYKVEKLWLIGIALDFKAHFISLMNFEVSPAVAVL